MASFVTRRVAASSLLWRWRSYDQNHSGFHSLLGWDCICRFLLQCLSDRIDEFWVSQWFQDVLVSIAFGSCLRTSNRVQPTILLSVACSWFNHRLTFQSVIVSDFFVEFHPSACSGNPRQMFELFQAPDALLFWVQVCSVYYSQQWWICTSSSVRQEIQAQIRVCWLVCTGKVWRLSSSHQCLSCQFQEIRLRKDPILCVLGWPCIEWESQDKKTTDVWLVFIGENSSSSSDPDRLWTISLASGTGRDTQWFWWFPFLNDTFLFVDSFHGLDIFRKRLFC
jgi:hypothetical protein